jgi:hypothetical protein
VQEFEVESDEGMTASGDKQTRSIIGKWSFKTEPDHPLHASAVMILYG